MRLVRCLVLLDRLGTSDSGGLLHWTSHIAMAEIRQSSVSGQWVIFSPKREDRPNDFIQNHTNQGPSCPFCRGHEHETGAETFVFRDGKVEGAPDWRVRVVHNKFPAVSIDADQYKDENTFLKCGTEGMHMAGFGSHEVVVETPDHDVKFEALPIWNIREILHAYRARIRSLKEDGRFRYVQIFKNYGHQAGASLKHSHSQIIALPIVPTAILDQIDHAKKHFDTKGKCILCEEVECEGKTRLVAVSVCFLALSPFAPRVPFETWIIPKRHASNFGEITETEVEDLANILHLILKKLEKKFDDVSYNYAIFTAPLNNDHLLPHVHWHISIMPRLGVFGGFELATGAYINPVPPEGSAQILKGVPIFP